METVNLELIRKIFLHINRTEKQAELLPDRQKWSKLTSALYTLEDSSNAVEYYIESVYPSDFKGKYLFTYGLFQALFLQQDSVNSINKVLSNKDIAFKTDYPYAYSVRELRNDTIGHPTNRSGDKQFIRLAQQSMNKFSFYYCKDNHKDGEQHTTIPVNIEKAITDTSKCVNSVLQKAVKRLDKEFKEYIEKHKDRKMSDIFSELDYAREKIFSEDIIRVWSYNATKDMVAKCEEEIRKRYGSVKMVDSYKALLDDIHELYTLIDDSDAIPDEKQKKLLLYLVELLFVKLYELKRYCKETDEYFETYGEPVIGKDEKFEGVTILFDYSDGTNPENDLLD